MLFHQLRIGKPPQVIQSRMRSSLKMARDSSSNAMALARSPDSLRWSSVSVGISGKEIVDLDEESIIPVFSSIGGHFPTVEEAVGWVNLRFPSLVNSSGNS